MAHARHGVDRGCAGRFDWVATLARIYACDPEIWFSFPNHIHLGPSGRTVRGATLYLRNTCFFAHRAPDCSSPGIATAAYLTELAPLWIRQALVSLIEMLAAIPSVILGLWGIFVMIPWLRDYPFPFLKRFFGWTPFFTGPIYGPSMLAGGIIIAIMILPIITSVSREILRSVPDLQREAAYALGVTRWEATRIAVLSYAKKGLFGAVILGLGRALGETMAVTMVIGNTPQIAASLFKPGYTLASVLANEFTEATTDMYLQALFEVGLVLFGITILVNLLAQLLLRTIAVKSATRAVQ